MVEAASRGVCGRHALSRWSTDHDSIGSWRVEDGEAAAASCRSPRMCAAGSRSGPLRGPGARRLATADAGLMQFTNETKVPAGWTLGFDRDGRKLMVVPIKATDTFPRAGGEPEAGRQQ